MKPICKSITNNDDTVIIIPVRMAATRLPNKPLAEINGKPMIIWVIEKAKLANFAPVFVATPDEEIKEIVEQHGGKAIITKDHPTGTDRIHEALNKIDPEKKIKYIINLQGDLPLIDPGYIKILWQLLKSSDYDISTLGAPIQDEAMKNNPNNVKIAFNVETNKALYFSRAPIPYSASNYYYHIGIYGYTRESIEKFVSLEEGYLEKIEKLEQLRALENNLSIGVGIVDSIPLSVDTKEDLAKVIAIATNN
ncbi:MAG: 3-deoxy-manno-octulosonate cytidylyltransferase [Alphaproteobacteria bacterium]